MQFPQWADGPDLKDEDRARRRLTYLILRTSLELTGGASLRAFANLVGCDHTVISRYIQAGSFSYNYALVIENALGKDVINAQHLVDPLTIPAGK